MRSAIIQGLVETNKGVYWIATNKGLVRFDPLGTRPPANDGRPMFTTFLPETDPLGHAVGVANQTGEAAASRIEVVEAGFDYRTPRVLFDIRANVRALTADRYRFFAAAFFCLAARRWRIRFARSSSARRVALSFLPPRLMKY